MKQVHDYTAIIKFLERFGDENGGRNLKEFLGVPMNSGNRYAVMYRCAKNGEVEKLANYGKTNVGFHNALVEHFKLAKPEPTQEARKEESIAELAQKVESLTRLVLTLVNDKRESTELRFICSRCHKNLGIREAKQSVGWYGKEYCFGCAQAMEDTSKKLGGGRLA